MPDALINATAPDFDWRTRDPAAPLKVFHGTHRPFDSFQALSHFGSFAAAAAFVESLELTTRNDRDMERMAFDHDMEVAGTPNEVFVPTPMPPFRLIEADLVVKNPLYLFDEGSRHRALELLHAVPAALARAGLPPLTADEVLAVQESLTPKKMTDHDILAAWRAELESAPYFPAGADDAAIHECLAKQRLMAALEARGVDGFVYRNRREDLGHVSWTIFRPDQVVASVFHPAEYGAHRAVAKALGLPGEVPGERSWIGTDDWQASQYADRFLQPAWDGRRTLSNGLNVVPTAPLQGFQPRFLSATAEGLREQFGPLFPDAPGPMGLIIADKPQNPQDTAVETGTPAVSLFAFFGPPEVARTLLDKFGGKLSPPGTWFGEHDSPAAVTQAIGARLLLDKMAARAPRDGQTPKETAAASKETAAAR